MKVLPFVPVDTIYGGFNIGFQFNNVSEYFRDPMDKTIKTASFMNIPEKDPYTRVLVDFPVVGRYKEIPTGIKYIIFGFSVTRSIH